MPTIRTPLRLELRLVDRFLHGRFARGHLPGGRGRRLPPSARCGDNPWGEGATTLEWTLSSPPPFHQYNDPGADCLHDPGKKDLHVKRPTWRSEWRLNRKFDKE
jgi:hypothetical protein